MKRNGYRMSLALLGLVFLIIIVSVGYTWQLAPLLFGLLIILVNLFLNKQRRFRFLTIFLLLCSVGASLFCFYLFPLITLPVPGGSYEIGVRYKTVQTDRPEAIAENPVGNRTIYLKIWYPASTTKGYRMNPYVEGGKETFPRLVNDYGIPTFFFNHFTRITTHGFEEAPMATGRFPLVTFSHGYGSWFGQNTTLMEEMASRGFIVAALTHSHQSMYGAINSDSIITFPKVVRLTDDYTDSVTAILDSMFLNTTDRAEQSRLFYEIFEASQSLHKYNRIWGQDITSVLDVLLEENQDPDSFLFERIDTTRIGASGMSFGGAASGQASLKDPRVKAGLNMDGTAYGDWYQDTLRVPFLFMEAERSPYNFSIYSPFTRRNTAETHIMIFKGAGHGNFTDMNLYSPIFDWIHMTGPIDKSTMLDDVNHIVPDYFEQIFDTGHFNADPWYEKEEILIPR